jgi:hypothetical protein
MKINQVLVESAGATVAFAFGRFNPAHQGHIEVWRTVEQAGANWFIGTNPSTLGPNDPLTFQQKSAWMEEIYPPISGHIVAEQSVLTLAAYIFKKVRKNENATVAYITDAADWAWSGKLLNQYNGVEGAHGYYKFAQIVHVPSPRVSSATALRDAARADDKVAFYHASGTDPKSKVSGLTYFDTVKQAVEKYPLPVKRGQKVKEQGVAESDEARIAYKLQWPELVNKVNSAMKAMGWKGQRKDDGAFMYSTKGQLDNEFYMVIIENDGEGFFTYALGTVEEGDPYIDDAYKGQLPTTEASVSELMNEIREGFGLNENNRQPNNPYGYKVGQTVKLHNKLQGRVIDIFDDSIEVLLTDGSTVTVDFRDAEVLGEQGVTEGVAETMPMNDAVKVLKHYGAGHFKTTSNELHFYKDGRPFSVDLIWNDDATRSVRLSSLNSASRGLKGQGVTEDAQKTVAKTWDQMTSQEKLSGVKGRTVWNERTQRYYTVFDVPAKQATDEASLATMRDYFAGDKDAHDPMDITKQRLHFSKDKNLNPTIHKNFRSKWDYDQWLKQNKLKQVSGVQEDDEAGEVKKQGQLIPWPAGTTKVHVSDVYDWYKLGMVISDLDDANPADFGQGAPQTVIAFGSEEEESKLLPLLQRLGLRVDDIDPEGADLDEAYHAGELYEYLKKVHGKWALVSKNNPKKVLQYYRGGDDKPSDEWVNKVERRVHSFESKKK